MADGVFGLEVVTPEQSLYAGGARSVVLATSEGDLTVLDGHTPLVGDVVPCEVRVEPEEGDASPWPCTAASCRSTRAPARPRGWPRATARCPGSPPGSPCWPAWPSWPRRSTWRAPKPPRARPHPSAWPTCRRVAAPVRKSRTRRLALAEAEGALARAELRVEVAAGEIVGGAGAAQPQSLMELRSSRRRWS